MKSGHRSQLDRYIELKGLEGEKKSDFLSKVLWLGEDWWYIPEEGDGEDERKILEKLAKVQHGKPVKVALPQKSNETKKRVVHKLVKDNDPRAPLTPSKPPAKEVPPLDKKALQLFKAVTGPLVTDEVYNSRMRKCMEEGGWTWSTIDGTVTEVGSSHVKVDNLIIPLRDREIPSVAVGDKVVAGQPVCTGPSSPCPFLKKSTVKEETNYHCGACGCGQRKAAELTEKLYYARVVCPRTPPLFNAEDESGPNVEK